ncbi:MAG: aspartate/tyrosine/aromatic aminotransferase [Desulfobacula sp.]|uniref:aromatic amino acid transaminase n=1 Tax=Desulfobacula sp. TaxID=2593537 RepID=UPI002A079E1F|nr:aspartate/tyrosine/aromatic aminotransferase [Desulfobacula sp.]
MFANLPLPQPDEIVPLMIQASEDHRAEKVDLTVGVYRDDSGHTPIMRAVREAEKYLAVNRTTKSYVGPLGDPIFVGLIQEFAFQKKIKSKFIRGIQTPGGSSALSLILNLIKKAQPHMTIWVSDPTYANHGPTIKSIGLKLKEYPFLNRETNKLKTDSLMSALDSLGPKDAVLLHGSCHNPTGLSLYEADWRKIADIAQKRGFFPIIDTAYQGLGSGIKEDAKGLIIMAEKVNHLAVSFSCSKNFGLYNDRVGCAFLMGTNEQEINIAQTQLAALARPCHWVAPQNGSEIVRHIMLTPQLKIMWLEELSAMKKRIAGLRQKLALALQNETQTKKYDFIAKNSGLFSILPGTPRQMEILRKDYAVYGLDDGRINIAGLSKNKISYLAKSIATVI